MAVPQSNSPFSSTVTRIQVATHPVHTPTVRSEDERVRYGGPVNLGSSSDRRNDTGSAVSDPQIAEDRLVAPKDGVLQKSLDVVSGHRRRIGESETIELEDLADRELAAQCAMMAVGNGKQLSVSPIWSIPRASSFGSNNTPLNSLPFVCPKAAFARPSRPPPR